MEELTIAALQARMDTGELSARSLTEAYLGRIERLDRQGPTLNAVLELNPDAPAIAAALDAERRARGPRGLLHGIPVLLKDNIDTGDRMMTTAGSLALEGSIAPQDSTVAYRLREAGAVILGKTNLSEWANFRSNHSTSGWSSRGGQTCNPYALDRNPSGSSSGSAVAVAANLCPVAVGTETDGSIISPAQTCGIVGIKPTVGLISRAGIIPIAASQDTAGPMACTVADAAILLGALALGPECSKGTKGPWAGADPRDPATEGCPAHADYTRFLDPDGLRGARIGVARQFCGFNERVDRIVDSAVETMRSLGAEVIDPVEVKNVQAYSGTEFTVLLYEFKDGLNRYLAGLGPAAPVRSLAEVIAFNEEHRAQVMPYFGQDVMLMAEQKGPLTSEEYLQALATNRRFSRDEGIDATLRRHRLDAIVAPSGGPAWTTDWVNGDHYTGGNSSPAAVAGYPSITVPAGYVFGLPVGLSFFAGAYQEPVLIRLAYAFEKATRVRRPPRFLPYVRF